MSISVILADGEALTGPVKRRRWDRKIKCLEERLLDLVERVHLETSATT
jgi:hypothetical protein